MANETKEIISQNTAKISHILISRSKVKHLNYETGVSYIILNYHINHHFITLWKYMAQINIIELPLMFLMKDMNLDSQWSLSNDGSDL